ncbi:hypothetical protein [Phytohabitans houttuyneae]|uniref:hypothetical protein n=1 Tax=Phytohabitans houttuyneae TaxID=1076126 RepID=UPI001FEABFB8|nr:hypothetical protein [Phytohabitans houttuyneae]
MQAALSPQPEAPRHGAEAARHGAEETLPSRRPATQPESSRPGTGATRDWVRSDKSGSSRQPLPERASADSAGPGGLRADERGDEAAWRRLPGAPGDQSGAGQASQAQSVPPVAPPRPSFGPTASRPQAGASMTPQQWREARDAGKGASAADVPPGFRPQPAHERPGYDTTLYERPVSPPAPSRAPLPQARAAAPAPARPAATWANEWPEPERAPEPGPRVPGRPTDLASDPVVVPAPAVHPVPVAPPPPPAAAPAPAATSQVAPPPPVRTPEPEALPQRVPSEPDVPTAPEPPVEPPADGPDLTRIWSHLQRDDVQPRERPEGFDVQAILGAVRSVEGVRDASLRTTQAGAHSLRLDLADGADPAEVSRIVARLLQDRMGLAAAPKESSGPGEPAGALAPARVRSEPTATGSFPAPAGSYLPAQAGGPIAEQRRPAPETPRRRARRAREESPLGQSAPVEPPPPPPRPLPAGKPGPRIVIDEVQVSTFGLDATVEVRLAADERRATGRSNGPAVDAYVLRLCAEASASAVDDLLSTAEQVGDRGKCFVEHAAVVPFGSCEVAVVVVLLVCGGWVEQLAGSALVAGDPRQAVVRATLNAVNRRLEALLA